VTTTSTAPRADRPRARRPGRRSSDRRRGPGVVRLMEGRLTTGGAKSAWSRSACRAVLAAGPRCSPMPRGLGEPGAAAALSSDRG
jgi:hypothetical protein